MYYYFCLALVCAILDYKILIIFGKIKGPVAVAISTFFERVIDS